jgi:hypothetical protein
MNSSMVVLRVAGCFTKAQDVSVLKQHLDGRAFVATQRNKMAHGETEQFLLRIKMLGVQVPPDAPDLKKWKTLSADNSSKVQNVTAMFAGDEAAQRRR